MATCIGKMPERSLLDQSLRLLTLSLATWRVSSMLVQEEGPGRLLIKLRELTGIEHDTSDRVLSHGDWTPLYCVWCTSLWAAPLVAMLPSIIQRWLAVSALAIIIHEKLT